jgi:mannose-1-phosphate guanylyltransferase
MENTFAVIMAGGGGTRLWPLSRASSPKQSLRLAGDRSLFQMAVDRIIDVIPAERILVVTVEEQLELLREQMPSLPLENFLLEPQARGTASVVGLAAIELLDRSPDAVMAVLTSDHLIRNHELFHRLLRAASDLASKGELVTLGIRPSGPATGFGYIEMGELQATSFDFTPQRVLSFTEKPSADVAREYLATGNYCWNSGMFVWRADRIRQEIRRHLPDLHATLEKISSASDKPTVIGQVWADLRKETIDYGVMEKADRVTVIPADDLDWMDVGGWSRIFDLHVADERGNVLLAEVVKTLETSGSLIYQASGASARLIATIGIDDLVIVDTPDALLVCHRDKAELVRKLVDELASDQMDKYL